MKEDLKATVVQNEVAPRHERCDANTSPIKFGSVQPTPIKVQGQDPGLASKYLKASPSSPRMTSPLQKCNTMLQTSTNAIQPASQNVVSSRKRTFDEQKEASIYITAPDVTMKSEVPSQQSVMARLMSARASKVVEPKEEQEMPRQSVLLANDLQNLTLAESAAEPANGQVPAKADVE